MGCRQGRSLEQNHSNTGHPPDTAALETRMCVCVCACCSTTAYMNGCVSACVHMGSCKALLFQSDDAETNSESYQNRCG